MAAKDAAVAFRVSDDDLEIIDAACRIQMDRHPGKCSRNDMYRSGGIELARRIIAENEQTKDTLEDAA